MENNKLKYEIFDKLQRSGILTEDAKISRYKFEKDGPHINIYDNDSGEVLYRFEIK